MPQKSKPSRFISFIIIFIFIFAIVFSCFFLIRSRLRPLSPPFASFFSPPSPSLTPGPSQSFQGKLVCLPDLLPCSLALLTDEGKYYTFQNFSARDLDNIQFKAGDTISAAGIILGATQSVTTLHLSSLVKKY